MYRLQTISNTNYFENIKNNVEVFSGSWDPPPPQGEGPGDPRIPQWEKLEYCNTHKIILYKFLIIFYKTFFKIEKKFYFEFRLQSLLMCSEFVYICLGYGSTVVSLLHKLISQHLSFWQTIRREIICRDVQTGTYLYRQ